MPFVKTKTISTTSQGETVQDSSWKTGTNLQTTTEEPTKEITGQANPTIKEHTVEFAHVITTTDEKNEGPQKTVSTKSPSTSITTHGPGRTVTTGGPGKQTATAYEDASIQISFKLRIHTLNNKPVCPT